MSSYLRDTTLEPLPSYCFLSLFGLVLPPRGSVVLSRSVEAESADLRAAIPRAPNQFDWLGNFTFTNGIDPGVS